MSATYELEELLREYAKNGDLEKLQYLVEDANIDPDEADYSENTPLIISAQQGHLEIVKYLMLETSVDYNAMNRDGYTAMTISAKEGHLPIVDYILDYYLYFGFNEDMIKEMMEICCD